MPDGNPPITKFKTTKQEREYLLDLLKKLNDARTDRDQARDWFDGMTFLQYLKSNEEGYNATTTPRKDSKDWRAKNRGQKTHKKVQSIVSAILNQNLTPIAKAFDEEDSPIRELSEFLTSAVKRTGEIEDDEETKRNLLEELCKHGFVFVEENFEASDRVRKEISMEMLGALDTATFSSGKTVPDMRDAVKRVLRPDQVYLGDIRQPEMKRQPYIFTYRILDYGTAKSIYGEWKNFKKVSPGGAKLTDLDSLEYIEDYRLNLLQGNQVEEIRYQNRWTDEYAVILNGVLMLKPEFPMTWKHKEYNIVLRRLFSINPFCAYGHGVVHKLKGDRDALDRLTQMAIDKTKQSVLPPLASMVGRALSKDVFIPGSIVQGLDPQKIAPIIANQGVTNSEYAMMNTLNASIDEVSVSRTFTGSAEQGGATATQIVQQTREAMKTLGYIILSYSWLLRDLAWLRSANIIENYGDPIGEKVGADGQPSKNYRVLSSDNEILEGGLGTRSVFFLPRDRHPKSEDIFKREEMEKRATGLRHQFIYLDVDLLRDAKYRLKFDIEPREKETSDTEKILFREFMEGTMAWFPEADRSYLSKEYARIWRKPYDKLFPKSVESEMPGTEEGLPQAQSQLLSQVKAKQSGQVLTPLGT